MSQEPELDAVAYGYVPESWFHPIGIHKVVRKIEERLPKISGNLFITLTLDPALFAGPEAGFDRARDRIRRLFYKLRKGVKWEGKRIQLKAPYCVKLEFHESGWPHFHILFLTRRFLPGPLLNHLWGYGRTNVARISNKEFRYLLKYVTKSGRIPDWVLQRTGVMRIFQASRGFYRKRDPPTDKAEPKGKSRKSEPIKRRGKLGKIGDRIKKWDTTVQIKNGERYSCVQPDKPWSQLLSEKVYGIAKEGRYLGEGKVKITSTKDLLQLLSDKSIHTLTKEL